MTTLPPEDNEQVPGTVGDPSATPPVDPSAPTVAPDAQQPTPPASFPEPQHPAAPQQPGAPTPPPGYGAPQQPGYGAPGQPAYGAPQPGYGAPQQPGYGAPQQPGYGYYQPQQGQQDPLPNLTASYWLSVFFLFIPALIFYLIESPRATPQVRALHAANLNFSLLRVMVIVATWILGVIPYLGWVLAPLLEIGRAHV